MTIWIADPHPQLSRMNCHIDQRISRGISLKRRLWDCECAGCLNVGHCVEMTPLEGSPGSAEMSFFAIARSGAKRRVIHVRSRV